MKLTLTFEGFYSYDQSFGDCAPSYMMHPVFSQGYDGKNDIQQFIFDYLIRYNDSDRDSHYTTYDQRSMKHLNNMFNKVKSGKGKQDEYYWKRIIEWDNQIDDENQFYKILESCDIQCKI